MLVCLMVIYYTAVLVVVLLLDLDLLILLCLFALPQHVSDLSSRQWRSYLHTRFDGFGDTVADSLYELYRDELKVGCQHSRVGRQEDPSCGSDQRAGHGAARQLDLP